MDNNDVKGNLPVRRKPRVGVPSVPLSPKTRKVREENERIMNHYKNHGDGSPDS